MTTGTQAELISLLEKVWTLSPDVRLGQLFAHLGFLGECLQGRGLGDMEDEELLQVLHHHHDELLARNSAAPTQTE